MRHAVVCAVLCVISSLGLHAGITVEECVDKAIANYPLVRKYGLMTATKDVSLDEINRSWLPRLAVSGQATVQNAVPSFPDALADVIDKMGHEMKGLGKVQYKAAAEVSQTIWDGGAAEARRGLARSTEALQRASVDVEMYSVRERVENLYFAILLTEEHISQSRVTLGLLTGNLEKLRSMERNGTAMRADVDMVEAQTLVLGQTIAQARSAADSYRRVLSLFTGESLDGVTLEMPSAEMPAVAEPDRPELRLFDCRLAVSRASQRLADTALYPRVGFFAQAYYGYPGFNYFQSMVDRDMSFNILAGIKLSWNIDAFYTKKTTARKTAVDDAQTAVDRDLFLFNTAMQTASQSETINGLREVMKDDSRIVALRASVRKAAESQLENGIIDTTALLSKISDESLAQLTARFHEIQLLQEIYKLKYTLDR